VCGVGLLDPGLHVFASLVVYAVVVLAPPLYFTWCFLRRAGIRPLAKYVASILTLLAYVLLAAAGALSTVSYLFLSLIVASLLYGRVSVRVAVLLGFIASGLIGGYLQALYWPSEGAVYFDIWGNVVGENLPFRYPWRLLLGSLAVWWSIGSIIAVTVKPGELHRVVRLLR
jgi:hypothetical protein